MSAVAMLHTFIILIMDNIDARRHLLQADSRDPVSSHAFDRGGV